jgi:hypothetical protein
MTTATEITRALVPHRTTRRLERLNLRGRPRAVLGGPAGIAKQRVPDASGSLANGSSPNERPAESLQLPEATTDGYPRVRVLIADDHGLIRDGLRRGCPVQC